MSGTQKKGFSAFLKPAAPPAAAPEPAPPVLREVPPPTPREAPAPAAEPAPERTRQVTSTGRVRTHSANRQLPGVTLRLSEQRWERLKMLSLQERRPIQDILGDAMEAYMQGRGLPW
jgi:predicted DNA-binding protein